MVEEVEKEVKIIRRHKRSWDGQKDDLVEGFTSHLDKTSLRSLANP